MRKLGELDYKILNILQEEFPLSPRPFLDIAHQLELTEEEVITRIRRLYEDGIIRRLGGVMDAKSLGFYSTLCACWVPEDSISRAAGIINSYREVTHNYVREHDQYNIWFTLTSTSQDEASRLIREIEELAGVKVEQMPARKVYKIKVSFEMGSAYGIS